MGLGVSGHGAQEEEEIAVGRRQWVELELEFLPW
jgi:hypothetical protein